MNIGQRIGRFRVLKGLSKRHLARLAGASPEYIGRIEDGTIKSIGSEKLFSIAKALGVDLNDLIGTHGTVKEPEAQLSLDEKHLIASWRSLGKRDREFILHYIERVKPSEPEEQRRVSKGGSRS